MNKDTLSELVSQGLSTYQIAHELKSSQTNVRYYLKKYGLKTIKKERNEQIDKKLCPKCNLIKPIGDFYTGGKKIYSYCRPCGRRDTIDRQRKIKADYITYKGGKCEKCGYNRCQAALEFHHIYPKVKEYGIAKNKFYSLDKTKAELDKCLLVCANCHREIHNESVEW